MNTGCSGLLSYLVCISSSISRENMLQYFTSFFSVLGGLLFCCLFFLKGGGVLPIRNREV